MEETIHSMTRKPIPTPHFKPQTWQEKIIQTSSMQSEVFSRQFALNNLRQECRIMLLNNYTHSLCLCRIPFKYILQYRVKTTNPFLISDKNRIGQGMLLPTEHYFMYLLFKINKEFGIRIVTLMQNQSRRWWTIFGPPVAQRDFLFYTAKIQRYAYCLSSRYVVTVSDCLGSNCNQPISTQDFN